VRRFETEAGFLADVIYDEDQGLPDEAVLVDPVDPTRHKRIPPETRAADLLEPVVRAGRVVYAAPSLDALRARTADQIARLHSGITRFVNPHEYPVGLSAELHELKTRLVLETRSRP
jgi:nicotinate phosphoribosyltransferase